MGHSTLNRYKMKLNKSEPSYDGLINTITSYLAECQKIDENSEYPGEGYNTSVKEVSGELVVSFYSYKSRAPVTLSSDIIQLIKNNINSDPAKYYYYLEEEGYDNWPICSLYGKAEIVALCSTIDSSRLSSTDDLKNFHNALYADPVMSIELHDAASIIKLMEILEVKGREISYLNNDINRILVPIWRNPENGTLFLVGRSLRTKQFTLYGMKVTKSGERKLHNIVEFEKDELSLEKFIENHKEKIVSNLTTTNMVLVAIKRYYSENSYTGVKFQHADFRRNINLFNAKGPLIEVKNKIV